MTLYTHDEVKDRLIGKIGTPKRDKYELKLKKEMAKKSKPRPKC